MSTPEVYQNQIIKMNFAGAGSIGALNEVIVGPQTGDLYYFGEVENPPKQTILRMGISKDKIWLTSVDATPSVRAQVIDPTETYIYLIDASDTGQTFYRVS